MTDDAIANVDTDVSKHGLQFYHVMIQIGDHIEAESDGAETMWLLSTMPQRDSRATDDQDQIHTKTKVDACT